MTQASDEAKVSDSIERWQAKSGSIQHVSTWMNLAGNVVVLVASAIVLYWVKVKRKRQDDFLLILPTCFILCSVFAIPTFVIKLTIGESEWVVPMAAANIFFSLVGYWLFAVELLRTSFLLPKLFAEAKLEWMLPGAKDDATFPYSSRHKKEAEEKDRRGWDVAKLQATINSESPSKVRLPETLHHF